MVIDVAILPRKAATSARRTSWRAVMATPLPKRMLMDIRGDQ